MSAFKTAIVLLLLLLGSPALGQGTTYRVDSAGGPLTLFEEVAGAFALWDGAGAAEVPVEGERPSTLFRFAGPELLGPDVVTVTLQRPAAEPSLEIVVHPDNYRDHPAALLHETGLVLGLSAGAEGVMQPLLTQDSPAEPQPQDIEQLRGIATSLPGDLNADGRVDFLDLLELAAAYGQRGLNLPADLDSDGSVGEADLFRLRELYTFTEPEEQVSEEQAETPEAPVEESVEEPAVDPADEPTEDNAEEAAEEPAEGPAEENGSDSE